MWVTASDAQYASCHHVLEEVAEKMPHRHACEFHSAHHAPVDRRRLRAFVAPVVQNHFPQCRERSHLTLSEVVVYRVSPVLAVKEQAVIKVVEVAQCLFHVAATSRLSFVNSLASSNLSRLSISEKIASASSTVVTCHY